MRFEGAKISAVLDTSFLVRVFVPSQSTPRARQELIGIRTRAERLAAFSATPVEFTSLLRKLVTRRSLNITEASLVVEQLLELNLDLIPATTPDLRRAWEIATLLNQGDTFDAMGYAVAEAIDGEFWTSDQRFSNAAAGAALERVRFVA